MTARPDESPAAIAARYGAVAPKGLKVTVCPPHTFSDEAEQITPMHIASRRANSGTNRIARDRRAADTRRRERDERVRAMMTLADGSRSRDEVASILGVSESAVRKYGQRAREMGLAPMFRGSR